MQQQKSKTQYSMPGGAVPELFSEPQEAGLAGLCSPPSMGAWGAGSEAGATLPGLPGGGPALPSLLFKRVFPSGFPRTLKCQTKAPNLDPVGTQALNFHLAAGAGGTVPAALRDGIVDGLVHLLVVVVLVARVLPHVGLQGRGVAAHVPAQGAPAAGRSQEPHYTPHSDSATSLQPCSRMSLPPRDIMTSEAKMCWNGSPRNNEVQYFML